MLLIPVFVFSDGCISCSCGILNWMNPGTGISEKVVVAAGGADHPDHILTSTEFLFLNDWKDNQAGWVAGPELLARTAYATITEYKDGY